MSHRVQEVTAVAVIDLARLTSRPVLVGSGPRSDVVLKGASVRHARMGLDALGPWVRDLGSTEGTRVNGQPIDGRTVLEPSDLVGIGQHLLRVHSSADRTAAPGPALAEALAHLPEDLAQRLRAEALADRWEADAWRSLVSDPGAWLDHIDDREALLASIEAQLEAWGVADQLGTIDDDFAARSLPSSLGAAVKRRVQALQRWVGPLLTRAVPVRDLRTATKRFQLGQLARALEATGGNRAQAAERLGVSRQFIYRLLDHEES